MKRGRQIEGVEKGRGEQRDETGEVGRREEILIGCLLEVLSPYGI